MILVLKKNLSINLSINFQNYIKTLQLKIIVETKKSVSSIGLEQLPNVLLYISLGTFSS